MIPEAWPAPHRPLNTGISVKDYENFYEHRITNNSLIHLFINYLIKTFYIKIYNNIKTLKIDFFIVYLVKISNFIEYPN